MTQDEIQALLQNGADVIPVRDKNPGIVLDWQTREWSPGALAQYEEWGIRLDGSLVDVEVDSDGSPVELDLPETVSWSSRRGSHRVYRLSDDQRAALADAPSVVKEPHEGWTLEFRHGGNGIVQSVIPPSGGRAWTVSWVESQPAAMPDDLFGRMLACVAAAPVAVVDGDFVETLKAELATSVGRAVSGNNGEGSLMRACRHVLRRGLAGPIGQAVIEWYATEMSDPPFEAGGSRGWMRKWETAVATAERECDIGAGAVFDELDDELDDAQQFDDPAAPQLDISGMQNIFARYALAVDALQLEPDPVAVMMQSMEIFGCLYGQGVRVLRGGADRTPVNGFLAVVGERDSGRKGTSWSHAKTLFFDDRAEFSPIGMRYGEVINGNIGSGQAVVQDAARPPRDGVMLTMSHEGQMLFSAGSRELSSLTFQLNQAWDCKPLSDSTVTRGATVVRNPNVSVVLHIQPAMLDAAIDTGMAASGFLSRWLFVRSERPRISPNFRATDPPDFSSWHGQMEETWTWVKSLTGQVLLRNSDSAADMLGEWYASHPGEARSTEHAQRVAAKLAMARRSLTIEQEDVTEALQIVTFGLACKHYYMPGRDITDMNLPRKVAARIWASCVENRNEMYRSHLRKTFSSAQRDEVDQILDDLVRRGAVVAHQRGKGVIYSCVTPPYRL